MTTESSDYARVVSSSFFVDKTDLIKTLFVDTLSSEPFVKVRPGPHFSKSTNVNMLKKFFEIVVNENGTRECINYTDNYRLFMENNLKITRYKYIFRDNFGTHPVLSINYKPLGTVRNFKHLLEKYKEVLQSAFVDHKYLVNIGRLWSGEFNKTEFVKYLYPKKERELSRYEVIDGFKFLARLLHKHFARRVVLLMDDQDMIMDSPLSEQYRDKVFDFMLTLETELVVDNQDISRAFLTGCRRRDSIPGESLGLSGDSVLWQYYGLSHDELVELVRRFIKDNKEVEVAANTVVDLYSGYVKDFDTYDTGLGHNYRSRTVCSVWSVIQYFACIRRANFTLM